MRRVLWLGLPIFLIILAAIWGSFSQSGSDDTVAGTSLPPGNPPAGHAPKPPARPSPTRSEIQLVAEAEPLARRFLEATTTDAILAVCRHPDRIRPHLLRHHPEGSLTPPGLTEFNADGAPFQHNGILSVSVRTRDFSIRRMDFASTPDGLKIDWESWVGWGDIPWSEFLAQRPHTPHTLRVVVKKVDYYNYDFTDETKWRSYRLESRDGGPMLYAYVERGSVDDNALQLDPDAPEDLATLSLRFPENAPAGRTQVIIARVIRMGWTEPTTPP